MCAVREDGTVECVQLYSDDSTGDEHFAKVDTLADVDRVVIANDRGCAVHRDGTLSCWGAEAPLRKQGFANTLEPAVVKGVGGVKQVALDMSSTYVLLSNGDLLRFSREAESQSAPPIQRGVVEVSASALQACTRSDQGAVSCWKHSEPEAPERVAELPEVVSVAVGSSHACAATRDGAVYCWGEWRSVRTRKQVKSAERVENVGDVRQLSPGIAHTCALTGSGVLCWGDNSRGALGSDTDAEPFGARAVVGVPPALDVYRTHQRTLIISTDGEVYCAGWFCDRGKPFEAGSVGPRRLDGWSGARSVEGHDSSSGERLTLLLRDGTLRDWFGKVPDDRTHNWIAHVEGEHFTCAVAQGGVVYCKGQNRYGQLGNGTTEWSDTWVRVPKLGPAKSLSAGSNSVCAVLADTRVACWGEGFRLDAPFGRESSEGPSLPVVLGDSTGSTAVVANGSNPCIVSAGGEVRCWQHEAPTGWKPGQPRVLAPSPFPRSEPWSQVVDIAGDGISLRYGVRRDGTIASFFPVLGAQDAVRLAKGKGTCAITKAGTVSCWGGNQWGERGLGALPDLAIPVQGLD